MSRVGTVVPRRSGRDRAVVVLALVGVGALVSGCGQDGPYEGFSDRGDPDAVDEVRAAVVDLLVSENAVGRLVLDDDGVAAPELNTTSAASGLRSEELAAVATPARRDAVLPAIEDGVAGLVGSPDDAAVLGYTEAAFDLDSVDGVAVDGADATVVLSGAECYRDLVGQVACGGRSHFRLGLEAARDGRWLIASKSSEYLPGAGP